VTDEARASREDPRDHIADPTSQDGDLDADTAPDSAGENA
jgi:hypothetical protein